MFKPIYKLSFVFRISAGSSPFLVGLINEKHFYKFTDVQST